MCKAWSTTTATRMDIRGIPWALRQRLMRAALFKERVLHKLAPARMNVVPYAFPLVPQICPCDIHFCDFLEHRKLREKSIFHFGTGGHHIVGLRNWTDGMANEILAITVSPSEYSRYINRVVAKPSFGTHYKVLFADIYDLHPALLPEFDVVTLFHLYEFTPPEPFAREIRMDDGGVLDLFLSKLSRQGLLLFYAGSHGHRETRVVVERAVAAGKISFEASYKSLLVYRRERAALVK